MAVRNRGRLSDDVIYLKREKNAEFSFIFVYNDPTG